MRTNQSKKSYSIPMVYNNDIRAIFQTIYNRLLFDLDGVRLAQNTSLGILVSRPFQLKINELTYNVESPQELGILEPYNSLIN